MDSIGSLFFIATLIQQGNKPNGIILCTCISVTEDVTLMEMKPVYKC